MLTAVREVFASLYNDRAIAYRVHHSFEHEAVALSAGVQKMVRSDIGASGVMFTMDTESGFDDAVFITSSYGLGEAVVQGAVNPDEFYVYKAALRSGHAPILRRTLGAKAIKMIYGAPGATARVTTVDVPPEDRRRFSITDLDLVELAKQALIIEEHYGCPMDIEWGKDGSTGDLYILQARPETVQSRSGRTVQRFTLQGRGPVLAQGRSIGQRIGARHQQQLGGFDGVGGQDKNIGHGALLAAIGPFEAHAAHPPLGIHLDKVGDGLVEDLHA